MAARMLAAVVEQLGRPLELRRRDMPSPGAAEILVRTEACGVCHTDLHAMDGDWPAKPRLPFVPGHEVVGRVVGAGPGVKGVREGDRVGIPWIHSACGHCEHCLDGWETVCPEAVYTGYHVDGGFAEYLLADPAYAIRIPEGLEPSAAAPILCAGVTAFKGIKASRARPGEWMAISGIGGLGHLAIQYAKVMGLHVCAIDIDEGRLAHARRLGADFTVHAGVGDPAAAVREATGGGAHGVLVTAPSLVAITQGVTMIRKRGTGVLVGLPPGGFQMPLFGMVADCVTLRGSFVGSRLDQAEALGFAAEGRVRAEFEEAPLAAVNQVLDRLRRGEVPSRVVLSFPGG